MDIVNDLKNVIKNENKIDPIDILNIKSIAGNPISKRLIKAYTKNGTFDIGGMLHELQNYIHCKSLDSKLKFLFRIYDYNNDGFIDKNELYCLLKECTCLESNSSLLDIVSDTFNEVGLCMLKK